MNMDVGVDGPMDSVQVGKAVQNCVLFANMHSTQQNLTESLELKLSFSHNNELLASSRLHSSLIAFLRAESGSWGGCYAHNYTNKPALYFICLACHIFNSLGYTSFEAYSCFLSGFLA